MEEQKAFVPPTAISTSEEQVSIIDDIHLKDKLHLLCDSTDQKFEHIDEDLKNIRFALTDIKTTLTDTLLHQNQADNYHKKVDAQTSILLTLKNYIVSKNKLKETKAANQANQDNHPPSDFGAKTAKNISPSTHHINDHPSPNHYHHQTNVDMDTTYMYDTSDKEPPV